MFSKYQSLDVSEAKLKSSLSMISTYAENALKEPIDIYFTDHTISHSLRIAKLVDRLLFQNEQTTFLTASERYILASAALLHDLGMQWESAEFYPETRRERHQDISSEIIKRDWKSIGIIPDYVDSISAVIRGHRGNIKTDELKTISIGTCDSVRLDLLATLLYLGDELDIGHERIDPEKRKRLNYNLISAVHFFKHYYVHGIDIEADRCVKIVLRYPVGRTGQYDLLVRRLVCSKLKKVIDFVTSTLQDKHNIIVALREIDITSNESATLDEMPMDVYEKAHGESFGVRNFQFLQKLHLKELAGDIQPEIFYSGYSSWRDIVNGLDIARDQQHETESAISAAIADSSKNRAMTGVLITGGGCSGKSTLLMRMAYKMVSDEESKFYHHLWLPDDCKFNINELKNLYYADPKPILVFIDGISINATVSNILQSTQSSKPDFPLILIFAARLNEWFNANGDKLSFHSMSKIQLLKLSHREITLLLENLSKHNELHELSLLTPEERFTRLEKSSNGELLVAMLEATRGKGFFEIVRDEFDKLQNDYPAAAKAYEYVCLFYGYDVLIPKDLLITLSDCFDSDEFENRVLIHSFLVIIKDPNTRYGDFYRPRHKEIARILIDSLEDYSTTKALLKRVGVVLRNIDPEMRAQRYCILEFLTNFITNIVKFQPKAEYEDLMEDVCSFFRQKEVDPRIFKLIKCARDSVHLGELISWTKLFSRLRMNMKVIELCEMQVSLPQWKYNQVSNYRLAMGLIKNGQASRRMEEIAGYFRNSFLGGNRRIDFLYDYLHFCINNGLLAHVDRIVPDFNKFNPYTPEETEIFHKLEALIKGYNATKDTTRLSKDFITLQTHIEATSHLKPSDELDYINTVELKKPAEALKLYETFLDTVKPNRQRSVLLRIAHCATKISGEEQKAVRYFEEVYTIFIKPDPQVEDYPIIWEYATFCSRHRLQLKSLVYNLFSTCRRIKPLDIQCFYESAIYAKKQNDIPMAKSLVKEGLKTASRYGKYQTHFSKLLKSLDLELSKQ